MERQRERGREAKLFVCMRERELRVCGIKTMRVGLK